MRTCCFTGHRNLPQNQIDEVKSALTNEVIKLIDKGVIYYGAGGAIGFDTLAAQTIIELREDYPQIKLILIIPCRNQSDKWSQEDKRIYEDIKSKADKVVYLSEKYENGCMLKRNRHMVNHSNFVIAAWDGRKSGGTYYTINYAKKLKREITLLNLYGNSL